MTSTFPSPYSKPLVYHYTDAAGLIGMVTNHVIWATESAGLNDPREVVYGENLLRGHVPPERHRKTFERHIERVHGRGDDEVYVVSSTTRRDDISQWTRYTDWPSVGYCVGLDARVPLGVVRDDEPRKYEITATSVSIGEHAWTTPWSAVAYGRDGVDGQMRDFYPWAEELVREAQEGPDDEAEYMVALDTATSGLIGLTRLTKDPGFEAEDEVRVVATSFSGGKVVKYRPSRFGVVRYLELGAGERTQGFVVRPPKEEDRVRLPIVSVMIGPSPFAKRGLESVRQLLKANGYSNIMPKISTSRVR